MKSAGSRVFLDTFPLVGVRVELLDEFIQMCGGTESLKALTTEQVCERHIKPMTSNSRMSFCEQKAGMRGLAPATTFVSHPWKLLFLDLVAALKHRFQGSDDVMWLDIFSVSQHERSLVNVDWLRDTLTCAVRRFGHVVLVSSSWDKPIALTRAWCLFEIYTAASESCDFELALPPNEEVRFRLETAESYKTLEGSLLRVDVRESEATLPEDKAAIVELVEDVQEFNQTVVEQIRSGIVSANNLARLLYSQKKYDLASKIFTDVLERRRALLGPDHPTTLESVHNMGVLYQAQGRTAEALSVHKLCLDLRKEKLGPVHPHTLDSLHNLAVSLQADGKLEQAENLLAECVDGKRLKYGDDHPSTLTTSDKLAAVLFAQGKLHEAERWYYFSAEKRKAKLGAEHPDTITAANNLANLYQTQGKQQEAERLYEYSAETSRKVLGADHPDTQVITKNLAQLREQHSSQQVGGLKRLSSRFLRSGARGDPCNMQ
eukprot:c18930_g1_i3.p1 GENE.c18930_g1_i3~~c18930_g1_i3.p1  ORF type:complete len:489 (+),score=114.63 c18930_g1_i3:36-1502(+)